MPLENIVKLVMLLVSFSPTFLQLKPFSSIITNHSFVFGKKKRRNELHKLSLHLSFRCALLHCKKLQANSRRHIYFEIKHETK